MYWHGGGGLAWMAFFMPLVWIVLIGLVAWAVLRLAHGGGPFDRGRGQGGQPRGSWESRETPEEILDRRYASGEIDTETYTEAREHLAAHRQKPR